MVKYSVVLYLCSIRYGRCGGVSSLRAVQWINVLKKVARKRFIFRPSSINKNFSLDLSLKKQANYFLRGCTRMPLSIQIDRIAVDLRAVRLLVH